ncbi:MAG: hypothetical protein K8F27_02025 [Sulfuricellaceae bacterium]|nr:hypothetical protein [Sulfuricellaceae bacterium]
MSSCLRVLATLALSTLLTGCAVAWVDDAGRQNHLGLLWVRYDKAEKLSTVSVVQTRRLGFSLDAGSACLGVDAGFSEKVRVAYYPDGKYWRVHYDTALPFLSVIEELPLTPVTPGSSGAPQAGAPK